MLTFGTHHEHQNCEASEHMPTSSIFQKKKVWVWTNVFQNVCNSRRHPRTKHTKPHQILSNTRRIRINRCFRGSITLINIVRIHFKVVFHKNCDDLRFTGKWCNLMKYDIINRFQMMIWIKCVKLPRKLRWWKILFELFFVEKLKNIPTEAFFWD